MPSANNGKGMRWRARYVDDDSREHAKGLTRKSDAQKWLDSEVTAKFATGTYIEPSAGQVTVANVYQSWSPAQSHISAKTAATRQSSWNSRVEPQWGDTLVVDVRKRKHSDRGYLSHVQVVALASAVVRQGEVVRFLAYTGLRWGEMAALMVGKGRDDLVFTDQRGGVLRNSNWRARVFRAAVSTCQAADTTFPTITPHDLRHTAASLAVSAHANVKAVQRMLGHAKASMTLDIYADLFDEDLDGVADRLDAAIQATADALRTASKA